MQDISLERAIAALSEHIQSPENGIEQVSLLSARGRILAEDTMLRWTILPSTVRLLMAIRLQRQRRKVLRQSGLSSWRSSVKCVLEIIFLGTCPLAKRFAS